MNIHLLSSFRYALALLVASSAACSAEGPVDWSAEEQELGALEEAFTNPATAVSSAENAAVPFISAVKFTLSGSCSGVKIPPLPGSNRVRILTAGHCIAESANNRTVSITNATSGGGATTFTIPANRTFVHPSFQLGNIGGGNVSDNVYDLAFFEVDAGPSFAATATSFFPIGSNVSLTGVGYGKAGVNCSATGGTKLKAALTSVSVVGEDRKAHFIHHSGEPANCNGDSGGPIFLGSGANARVVGIVSAKSVTGTPPLSAYARVQNALEWINDPVDSTLATIPASLVAHNSAVYMMNGSLALTRPLLGCAALTNTSAASGTDVRTHTCDGPDGLISGKLPAWRLLTSPAGGGSFQIVNRNNGLCMGINVAPANLADVRGFSCASSGTALNRQSWTFQAVSGQTPGTTAYRLRLLGANGFCLSSTGSENDNVVIASCDASALSGHKWYLTR